MKLSKCSHCIVCLKEYKIILIHLCMSEPVIVATPVLKNSLFTQLAWLCISDFILKH